MMVRQSRLIGSITLLALLAISNVAFAQGSASPAPVQNGPLVLTPIASAIVFSPDAKITTVNGSPAVLSGGYVGKLLEKTALVGVGAYVLADPRDDARMTYGGLLFGGRFLGSDRVNLSARGLIGLGQATLFENVTTIDGRPLRHDHGDPLVRTFRLGLSNNFVIAEPEVHLLFVIVDGVNLNVGAGYRLIAATSNWDDRLRGATGSIGIQFNMK